MATTTCAGCRAVAPLATIHVYLNAPGAVARCPGCNAVLLRVVRHERRAWLDLSGIKVLQIELTDPDYSDRYDSDRCNNSPGDEGSLHVRVRVAAE